jgi:choline dehydrogenase-like flavoprotein
VPQSRYCDDYANLDGAHHGVRLETAPAHVGLWAMEMGWQTPRDHRRRMQTLAHLANIIVLTRDKYSGRVDLDRAGNPRLHYKLHPYDAAHMMQGTLVALDVQRAAGSLELCSPHYETERFHGGREADFHAFKRRVKHKGLEPNRFGLFSAHQLSSCRLAGNAKQGVVNPAGETYEIKGLYVADGSVLPSACGVNPMLTIMGLSHYLARQMATTM